MNIIILGAPGVGKGTIAKKLGDFYKIPHISMGDLLRDAVKNKTPLGVKAKQYMDKGYLVPNSLVIELLKQRINKEDCKNGFILDGFPRTIGQAKALKIKIDVVLNFQASEEIIIERLSGRRICPNCGAIYHIKNIPPKNDEVCDFCNVKLIQRDDDKPESIKNRLIVYKKQTQPLIEFYKGEGILYNIDAEHGVERTFNECVSVLEKYIQ